MLTLREVILQEEIFPRFVGNYFCESGVYNFFYYYSRIIGERRLMVQMLVEKPKGG